SYRHPLAAASLPFFHNQEWSYLDGWMNDTPQNWQSLHFDDRDWEFGQAPLGYGREGEVLTEISYGPDSLAKPMTAYFRREIYLDRVQDLPDSLLLGLRRDDGAVVYVNGAEVWRSNMPVGELNHHSPAAAVSHAQQDYHALSTGFFQQGLNVIAVEVHQAKAMDPDLIFDLELMPIPKKPSANWTCPGGQIGLTCFASLDPRPSRDRLILPPSHRWQLLFAENSAYSSGQLVAGEFGFLGYQGQNEEGKLLIGHESSSGQISGLDISLDPQSLLWTVDSSEGFGFDLFTTGESGPFAGGAFTPWGSLFLVESEPLSGDYNGDGRSDQGWILEWNPITKEPVPFSNQQAKGFAMGRIARRDIAFGSDGKTLYFGHSGQEGYLYKFVAQQVGSFDQGELMVLRLSDPFYGGESLGTQGTWQSLGALTGSQLEGVLASTPTQASPFGEIRGVEYLAKDGKVYFSSRATGRIYRFDDLGSSVADFEVLVGGQSYYVGTSQNAGLAQLGGLEQMAFDPEGNLWFLESGQNNRLWVIREGHSRLNPQMDLMAVLPRGVKGVSLSTSPDGKYLFLNVQVPGAGGQAQVDASFTSQTLDRAATLVIAHQQHLGTQPPAPGFTSNRRAVEVGQNVQFLLRTEPQPDSVWWYFEGGFPQVSTRFNPEVSYADPGSYDVRLVVAGQGGRDTLERQDYVQVNATTGFSNLGKEANLRAYPNPVLDWLYVDLVLTHPKKVELSWFTLDGRELAKNIQKNYPAGTHQLKVEPPIQAGPVVLRVQIGDRSHSEVIWSQRE
ncbi:MAG: PKD domain-containing protein, partial [Bacteroidota bacterium]